ncbi:MAG TPA: exonuclease domain-containing protein, partial [Sphingomicrobium sp.]|nr:exonuclease domain-containing protein [Sphingomicrobium sp.]
MREIVFDTETTGLSPAGGDRMVEIGCIEMIGRVET